MTLGSPWGRGSARAVAQGRTLQWGVYSTKRGASAAALRLPLAPGVAGTVAAPPPPPPAPPQQGTTGARGAGGRRSLPAKGARGVGDADHDKEHSTAALLLQLPMPVPAVYARPFFRFIFSSKKETKKRNKQAQENIKKKGGEAHTKERGHQTKGRGQKETRKNTKRRGGDPYEATNNRCMPHTAFASVIKR